MFEDVPESEYLYLLLEKSPEPPRLETKMFWLLIVFFGSFLSFLFWFGR